MHFQLLDWIILGSYLAGSVFIGLRAKKYVENMEGYFIAGRRVRVALGTATLIATEIGIVTFMYLGELGYVTGFSCFVLGLIGAFGYFIIGKTGFIVSGLRRLRVITIPEFYERRFGRGVRILGGVLLFLGGVLNMGVFLRMDGIFLAETMGFGQGVLAVIMVAMLLIVVSYTVLGGMFSVVITDFIQFVVLSLGMFIATLFVLTRVGFGDLASVVAHQLGDAGVNPIENPRFGWSFLFWMLIGSVAISALNQPAASKSFASENPEVGRKVFLYTGITLAGRYLIPMLWGVAALATFGPSLDSTIAMPRLLASVVPTGLLGLMVAGMLAASMSTYSAYMLAWSSVATRDIIGPLRAKPLSERSTISLTRAVTATIGLFILVFGLVYELPATVFQFTAITGAMYAAGAFGCVVGGLYWRKANVVGAYAALALGGLAPVAFLGLSLVKTSLPTSLLILVDVNISGFISFLLAAMGMIIGSLVTQKKYPPTLVHGEEGTD